MATKPITQQEFEQLSEGSGITLVDFWADWCAPCHRFAPIYEKVSDSHPDITFAKVDTEAEQALSVELGIQAIPTLMAIRDGVVVFQHAGILPENLLENVISQVQELNMDEVRAKAS
jgi:thioredoxin 1